MVSQRQKITQEKLKNAGNNNIYYVRKNISMKAVTGGDTIWINFITAHFMCITGN